MRAFIALSLPNPVCAALDREVAGLRSHAEAHRVRASWTKPGKWHVTLRFFADLHADRVDAVIAACAEVTAVHQPFTATLTNMHAFPSTREARVLVHPFAQGAHVLSRIAEEVPNEGSPREHAFVPHVTLGRVRDTPRPLTFWTSGVAEIAMPEIAFSELALFESVLGNSAPIHRALVTLPLKSGE